MPRYVAAGERLRTEDEGSVVAVSRAAVTTDRPTIAARPAVHVLAAVIYDEVGRVLITQRPSGAHLAGGWEFPGGKIEAGETRIEALTRELGEEIGVTLIAAHPLIRVHHEYPERTIDLDVWTVTAFRGTASGLEGQETRWCDSSELFEAGLVLADRPVITAIVLPQKIEAPRGPHYGVGSPGGKRLTGKFCSGSADAEKAAADADFLLAMRVLGPDEIERLTANLNVPVYVRDVPLDTAWNSGATGLHTLSGVT